jgi:hypothetical protein
MSVTPRGYQALVVKHGIEFYLRTGRQVNAAYTPKNMCLTASAITGETYGPRWKSDLPRAARDLQSWLDLDKGNMIND